MNYKLLLGIPLILLLVPPSAFSQSKDEAITTFISSVYSEKQFTEVPVDLKDLSIILNCGIKSPSARNSQPWHFTVIKDIQVMKKIIPDTLEGNVLIVVSGSEQGNGVAFDCSLATENMYLAAQALGLGSHIYTGPIANLNERTPEQSSEVSFVRQGN